ncbi:Flp/Fap pilin component [compost metagenome]
MIMQTIKASVVKFINDEDGLTVVEYAVAGGLVTALVVGLFSTLGLEVKEKIQALCDALSGEACNPPA